jgi:hypothetical protein
MLKGDALLDYFWSSASSMPTFRAENVRDGDLVILFLRQDTEKFRVASRIVFFGKSVSIFWYV